MRHMIRSSYRRTFGIAAFITLLVFSFTSFVPTQAAAPRKVVVFLQGMCTSIGDGYSSYTPTFGNLWVSLQLQYKYKINDLLVYSYNGGQMDRSGNAWIWRHYAYEQPTPFQQSVQTSVQKLHKQLTDYKSKNPDATFILVGHSLGGYIAFQELMQNVTAANYQTGLISKIITIDSPLQGAPPAFQQAVKTQNIYKYLLPCATGPMLKTLVDAYTNIHAQRAIFDWMFQQSIKLAYNRGVLLINDGNLFDAMYDPSICGLTSLRGDGTTQWLPYSYMQRQYFSLPRTSLLACTNTHSAALSNPSTVTTIAQQIGLQN